MSTTVSTTGSTASYGIFIEAHEVQYAGMDTGAMHLYLVYRDTDDKEYVIRSGPQYSWMPLFGDMKIETNVLMQNSADKRDPLVATTTRYSTALDFGTLSDDEAWAVMVKYARKIDAANTPYELFEENSNAFIGALLEAALDVASVKANDPALEAKDPVHMLPAEISSSEAIGLAYYADLMARVLQPKDGTVEGTPYADTITGIQTAEVIDAKAGNDTVSAGRGNDRIIGGAGKDRLTGSPGDDAFQFNGRSEGGDIITDFSNVVGNDDVFRISAAGFGGGLVAGSTLLASQFQSRSDNLAQDADDRFIFRTTDQTLWFDSNGKASNGLTLIADLQAGATVTHADILLV